ncbi:hypothetical protein [Bythopirellula goksoeyrii]|uniref:Uncharacterized protein n=1 Tax=Bythopirellula goksoeyrii TaxID=1400387 RepID=A0A5B9QEB1_9BACT|nr:hypothetical protein [Bythopirellula goksoeyrii]QEG36209.1 hypothetical protein Pr1d_35210 [Bythopirellula goksoeyrii]
MATTTIQWGRLPLLDTRDEHADDHVTVDDTLILLASGDLIIYDRWYRGNFLGLWGSDKIDYAFPGGHAYREKHSNRLTIRTGGPNRKTLHYEYQRILLVVSAVWYQLIPRLS